MKLTDKLNNLQWVVDIIKSEDLALDFVQSLCGEWIGGGIHRETFAYNLDPKYVIKVETENTGDNLNEWQIWNEVQGLTGDLAFVKDWLAPVKWISPNGRLLVMKRTTPHNWEGKKKLPEKVPAFLWDVKIDNFGWVGNKFMCHDYGQFYNFIHYTKRMNKAVW